MSDTPTDIELMLLEQQHICTSSLFRRKRQMVRLLSYLVSHAQDLDDEWFDQKKIAVNCLGRADDFSPTDDPAVRIEVARLRKLVEKYYDEINDSGIRLYIPKGAYRPVLIDTAVPENASGALEMPTFSGGATAPEYLTLLLSFSSDAENEDADMRFIRHQLRIGLSSNVASVPSLRLVINSGKSADSSESQYDFKVNFHLLPCDGNGCSIVTSVYANNTESAVFKRADVIPPKDAEQRMAKLINTYMVDVFDHEMGRLWELWLDSRSTYSGTSPFFKARAAYQRYLLEETEPQFEIAYEAIVQALRANPDDKLLNLMMADSCFRATANDYAIGSDQHEGLNRVLAALRVAPGEPRLHSIYALLSFFSRRYEICEVEASATYRSSELQHWAALQSALLASLMGNWEKALLEFDTHLSHRKKLPRLYAVGSYLAAIQGNRIEVTELLKPSMLAIDSQKTLARCLQAMSCYQSSEEFKNSIYSAVNQHLGISLNADQ